MSLGGWFAVVGLVPMAGVVWIIAARHRSGSLVAASRLVVVGASIFAAEHAVFATTCAAKVGCPVPGTLFNGDHVRLHMFMAGVYTVVGAAALIVVAMTLLREGRRAGWFTVLGALAVGGLTELIVGNAWFTHALLEDVTPGGRTFEDFAWMILSTYLFAWASALVISYEPVFGPRVVPRRQRTG